MAIKLAIISIVWVAVFAPMCLNEDNFCRSVCTAHSIGLSTSKWKDTISTLNCSIETSICSNSDPVLFRTNQPKDLFGQTNVWTYVYSVPGESYSRIALNFTWKFSHDLSIRDVTGFNGLVTNVKSGESASFFYCLNTNPSFEKHFQAVFYYDCYGRSNSSLITPGEKLKVNISSLPPSKFDIDKDLEYVLNVPDCRYRPFSNVKECVLARQVFLQIVDVRCAEYSVKFEHYVPEEFGNPIVVLCQGENTAFNECQSPVQMWNMSTNKDMTTYRLPDEFIIQYNYTIYVWGDRKPQHLAKASFCFSDCPLFFLNPEVTKLLLVVLICIAVILSVLGISVMRRRRKSHMPSNSHFPKESPSSECSSFQSDSETKKDPTVYIVFCDDHPKHKEIVRLFATHLRADYGFKVIFELWEQTLMSVNISQWVHESMEAADKILVIWSPGATKRWKRHEQLIGNASSLELECDYFVAVVRQIFSDLFCERNMGKYYFAFFDYGDKHCIPISQFTEKVCQTFVLMKDFHKLYFHLKDLEIHGPGYKYSVTANELHGNPAKNCCRSQLDKAILHMQTLVANCEQWYDMDIEKPLPDPASDIHLANEDAVENISLQLKEIEPLVERQRPPIKPISSVNPNADPNALLNAINFAKL